MGVWIETRCGRHKKASYRVTPCMGVWIETLLMPLRLIWLSVTPCMGVWIETPYRERHRI